MRKRGFTLIELLVVIAIIAILASILFPVFAKAREKARQTQCLNNVRQLAVAVQMYAQDNNSRYPGVHWDTAIESYAGSQAMFKCPSDSAAAGQVSYGYNGLLIGADGNGAVDTQIVEPTSVGAICDAKPNMAFGSGGLIGGGALSTDLETTVTPDPRHGGTIVGYCDGHAKMAPGKKIDLKDMNNGVTRAFYQAVGLGLIKNYGGGLENTGTPYPAAAGTVMVGGDYSGSQILLAAADVFTAKGGKILNRGFEGYDYRGEFARAKASGAYAWVGGSGIDELTVNANGAASAVIIGYDALVMIVSKNCKITSIVNASYTQTAAELAPFFANGYIDGTYQAYSLPQYTSGTSAQIFQSGTRKYFLTQMGTTGIHANAIYMSTDQEIVDAIAGDPYGIGYVSSSVADTDRVKILKIKNANDTFSFPNQNPRYAGVLPYPRPDDDTWGEANGYYPWIRPIYLYTSGESSAASTLVAIINNTDFQNGPLFKVSFWTNEPDVTP